MPLRKPLFFWTIFLTPELAESLQIANYQTKALEMLNQNLDHIGFDSVLILRVSDCFA